MGEGEMDDLADNMSGLKVDNPLEVRDRRLEVIQQLAPFPSLYQFFSEALDPIDADGKLIALLKPGLSPEMTHWMNITEVMAQSLYSRIAQQAQTVRDQRIQLKATKDALATVSANKKAGTGMADDGDDYGSNAPIQHPTPFSGDTANKADRTREYQAWRNGVRGFWLNRNKNFRSERAKLIYLSSVLRGSAFQGVAEGLTKITKFPDDQTRWDWQTAEAVIAELDKKYDTYDLQAAALDEWNKLEMAGDFADFNDFVAKFIDLTTTLKYNDETRVAYFEQKITRKLRDAIYGEPDLPSQSDFDGWVEQGRKYWHRQQRSANIAKTGKTNNNSNGGAAGNNGSKKPEQAGDPMDLDAIKIAMAKIPQEERERRYQQGLCLNCGLPGHIAKQCRKKTNANAPRGRGSFNFNPRGRGGGGGGGRGGFLFGGTQANPGGFVNNGFNNGYGNQGNSNQWGPYHGSNNGNNQGRGDGIFGRNGMPAGGFARGNNSSYGNQGRIQQLRFATTPQYIPSQPGFVVGETESDYSGDNSCAFYQSDNAPQQGNAFYQSDDAPQQGKV